MRKFARALSLRYVIGVTAIVAAAGSAQALTFVPTYIDDAGQTWANVGTGSTDGRVTLDAAFDRWEASILDPITIDVTVTFAALGALGPIGVWQGSVAGPVGVTITPGSPFITHNIIFNSDAIAGAFFDLTPGEASDLNFADHDAYSVALHEIGHLMGFTANVYVQDFGGTNIDPWSAQIAAGVFDTGGLNVMMEPDNAHILFSGASGGRLMEPIIFNGERRDISALELEMLRTAYGYSLVPLPATWPLLTLGACVLATLRRRAEA